MQRVRVLKDPESISFCLDSFSVNSHYGLKSSNCLLQGSPIEMSMARSLSAPQMPSEVNRDTPVGFHGHQWKGTC